MVHPPKTQAVPEGCVWRHLPYVPFFRALLRAYESWFFRHVPLDPPILDLGCGDGQFARCTFDRALDVGVDPWWDALQESARWRAYHLTVCTKGETLPFPDGSFATVISNSVLEHIPEVDRVLHEVCRVLRPQGLLIFSVPNHRFEVSLSLARWFRQWGLSSMAVRYQKWFQRISRHVHCDPPEVWETRLRHAGFEVLGFWHYFSPNALMALEWGHYLGLPSLMTKKLFGRWVVVPARWNLTPIAKGLRPFLAPAVDMRQGTYTFYVARKLPERQDYRYV